MYIIIINLARYVQKTNKKHQFSFFTKESKRFFGSLLTFVKVGLSLVLHLTQVRQANFMSMLDKMLQNNGIFWESMTFQHFVDMSTSCTTKFAGLVLFDVAFLPYMLSSCWWHINDKPKCCKIPLTWVICCNVNSLKIFVSRGYQTMTKKIGIFKNFYCIFGIFGAREVHHTKRKKTCLEVRFLP